MTPSLEIESRRVVTVLFCDISGSTALGGRLDPESVRRIMSRYFEEMRAVLERHGGTVEKYIGDAVMAVFGVPTAHEDDALRAVRASMEMQTALDSLNRELEPTWGVTIEMRTGVNTGEVVAGHPRTGHGFVVGDPVNVAARLEQVAAPGTVLIGESTYRLVRDAIEAEVIGPLNLKGKEESVRAWRVLNAASASPGWSRRLDSSLVGRDSELAAMQHAFERALKPPSCQVVSIIGPAGVGKSRLTGQFLSDLGGRTVSVKGRCLPYGEGITFWPVQEVIRDAADISVQDTPVEARGKLSKLLAAAEDAGAVGRRLLTVLGLGDPTQSIQEMFWGIRRLFEVLAVRKPLVVVFDDIHWGEPTFLDLLEYLASGMRDAPVVLLCLARPELAELREGWMDEKPNVTTVSLDPLSPVEMRQLMRNLLGGAELGHAARDTIERTAEGNPLFVEETMRMLVDEGVLARDDGRWEVVGELASVRIPPTINSLLTARLDRLLSSERAIIERAAVVGRVFWRDAVTALAPEDLQSVVGEQLKGLTSKELLRPDFSDLLLGDAFRFSHILIRDAAYAGIPKATRSELHERLAMWVQEVAGERATEYEEILGYHLEQAHRALIELGFKDERVVELGQRAAAPLATAGLRAFARGDMPAAVNLLSRSESLRRRDDSERLQLLPPLAFALMETGNFPLLQEVVEEAATAAAASGDAGLQAHVAILGLWIRLFTNPQGWADDANKQATGVIETFEQLGDDAGQSMGWSMLALVNTMKAQFQLAEQAWERAAEFARRAGNLRDELESLAWVPLTVWAGPARPEEAIARCQELLGRAGGDKKVTASALFMQAPFLAGLGRTDEARVLLTRARSLFEEVALTVWIAGPVSQVAGWVELTAGDPKAAEHHLRWGYETLSRIGDVAWLSTTVAILAEALYRQGRYDEAEQFVGVSQDTAAPDDVYSQALWRSVQAKVLARRGETEMAERLARDGAELAEPSDFLHLRSQVLMSLAETLQLAGRAQQAVPVIESAIALFEQKGNHVEAERARTHMRL